MNSICGVAILSAILVNLTLLGWCAESKPWEDASCDFEKKPIKLSPKTLVEEFLIRDSRGDFLKRDPWLDSVALCPGHLPGPDAFTVITRYKLGNPSVSKESATIPIEYEVVGTLTSGGKKGELNAFIPASARTLKANFELENTPYGWRLKDFPWQNVMVEPAKKDTHSRKWVDGDQEKFEAAIAGRRK